VASSAEIGQDVTDLVPGADAEFLVNTFRRCHSTVRRLMNNWVLISGLVLRRLADPATR